MIRFFHNSFFRNSNQGDVRWALVNANRLNFARSFPRGFPLSARKFSCRKVRHWWRMPGVNCSPPRGNNRVPFDNGMINVDGRDWSSYRVSFVYRTVYGIFWRVSKQCFQGGPPSFARMAHDEINCLNRLKIIVERWLRKIGDCVQARGSIYRWMGSFLRFERRRSLNNSLNQLVKVIVVLFCFKYVNICRINYLRFNYFGVNIR